jgi:hypothetical protein
VIAWAGYGPELSAGPACVVWLACLILAAPMSAVYAAGITDRPLTNAVVNEKHTDEADPPSDAVPLAPALPLVPSLPADDAAVRDLALGPSRSATTAVVLPPLPSLNASASGAQPPVLAAPRGLLVRRRPAALLPLYVSYIGLQAGDAATTIRALHAGATEANPVLGGAAGNTAALIGAKAGATAATLFFSERLWKHHPVAAVALMLALNGSYAAIVAHNASVVARH